MAKLTDPTDFIMLFPPGGVGGPGATGPAADGTGACPSGDLPSTGTRALAGKWTGRGATTLGGMGFETARFPRLDEGPR